MQSIDLYISVVDSRYQLQVFSIPAAEWAELLDEKNTDQVSAACDSQVSISCKF